MEGYTLMVILAATKVIPAGMGLFRSKQLSKSLVIFLILLWVGVVTETLLFVLASNGRHNLPVIHVYSIVEVSLLYLYFAEEIKIKTFRKIFTYFSIPVIGYGIAYALVGNNLYEFPSIPRSANALLILTGCFFAFYEFATSGRYSKDLKYEGTFYLTGGLTLYFSATLITWMMMKYVIQDKDIAMALYGSHSYVNAFCNLIYAIGLWVSIKSSLSRSLA